jgi:hypothetical protein
LIGFDGVGEHEERDGCGTQKQLQILNFRVFFGEDGFKNLKLIR